MMISRYAEELLARRPPQLTSSQAAKLEHRPLSEARKASASQSAARVIGFSGAAGCNTRVRGSRIWGFTGNERDCGLKFEYAFRDKRWAEL
jgi:hypothetical protein